MIRASKAAAKGCRASKTAETGGASKTAANGDRASESRDEGGPGEPLFFYLPDAKYGEFCQWFPSTFSVPRSQIAELVGQTTSDLFDPESSGPRGSITFSCAEQFMMYCKAARFGDTDRQRRVLATQSPKEQKALGKGTVGFDDKSWDLVKSEVVTAGNIAKFGQNPSLRNKLLATGDRLLVEAASRDRVWGIGYSEKHANHHRKHWGENRLGKALMAAREYLGEHP